MSVWAGLGTQSKALGLSSTWNSCQSPFALSRDLGPDSAGRKWHLSRGVRHRRASGLFISTARVARAVSDSKVNIYSPGKSDSERLIGWDETGVFQLCIRLLNIFVNYVSRSRPESQVWNKNHPKLPTLQAMDGEKSANRDFWRIDQSWCINLVEIWWCTSILIKCMIRSSSIPS